MRPRSGPQRGAVALLMLPFVALLVLWPMAARLAVLKAEQKRLDEEVRIMLTKQYGKPAPAPRAIADEAILGAEAEAFSTLRF